MKRVCGFALACLLLVGCEDTTRQPNEVPVVEQTPQKPRTYYALGQIVRHKVSGIRGQVIGFDIGTNPPTYQVRFVMTGNPAEEKPRLIGFTTETLYDYEIAGE